MLRKYYRSKAEIGISVWVWSATANSKTKFHRSSNCPLFLDFLFFFFLHGTSYLAPCVDTVGSLLKWWRCWDLRGRTPADCTGQGTPCYSKLIKTKRMVPNPSALTLNNRKIWPGRPHASSISHVETHSHSAWMYNSTQRQGLWHLICCFMHVSVAEVQTWDKEGKKMILDYQEAGWLISWEMITYMNVMNQCTQESIKVL